MQSAIRRTRRPSRPADEPPGVTYFLEKAFLLRRAGNSFPIPCGTCGKFGILQVTPGIHRLKCVRCAVVSNVEVSLVREGWQVRSAPASAA